MNLIEESFQNKEEKKKKRTTKIILGAIVLVTLIIIGITSYLMYIKSIQLKLTIDGAQNEKLKSLFIFDDDGTIYAPIKDIASYLGYESFSGEYKAESETINKCYVQSDNEIANFELNKTTIYKLDLTSKNGNYEYASIRKPVKAIDGKLYVSTEGLEKAFNISFEYNQDKNAIEIWTLPKLDELYSESIINYGYAELSEEFVNKKAILKGQWVAKKDDDKKEYGVIEPTGDKTFNTILEPKYDNITYLPETGDYLVEIDKKVGIMSASKQTKVQIIYDSIELMDSQKDLYLAKKDNKYGVIDSKGTTKVYIEYDEIGIDTSKFSQNNIKNKYLLVNNLIPVRKDKEWGAYDIDGNLVVDLKYDSFGYIASNNKDALNLLVIPTYDVIVGCKDKKYTLINSSGKEIFDPVADDIYMVISGGEKHYYIVANDQKIDAEEFLNKYGITAKEKTEKTKETEQEKTTENAEENSDGENEEEQTIVKEIAEAWKTILESEEVNDENLDNVRKKFQAELRKNDEDARVTKNKKIFTITYKGYEKVLNTENNKLSNSKK